MENMIPQIKNFVGLPDNVYMDIYDIPGLNDFKTRDIYFKWIEDNFSELDIILHIVDINSPLNTTDELNILEMIVKNIKTEKEKNDREVLLLTVINKCDEMDCGAYHFKLDEEDQENYDQVVKHTQEVVAKLISDEAFQGDGEIRARRSGKRKNKNKNKYPFDYNFEFTPISAADTFVYRMLHNDPHVELDMKLLQKFGINEIGKRLWNRMSDPDRIKMVKKHFADVDINETLEMTGYNRFKTIMNDYLTKERQSKILINRLKKEINNEEIMNNNITTNKDELNKLINVYNSYCERVYAIDNLYQTNNSSIITELINVHISRWINDISDLSNESDASIIRLEDYKSAIDLLRTSIDKYALKEPVSFSIADNKKKRWIDSFGMGDIDSLPSKLFISTGLDALFSGYSKLQNDFYLSRLNNQSTYQDFPNKIFENIKALQMNKYDAIDPTIDSVIANIRKWISVCPATESSTSWIKEIYENEKNINPMSGYFRGIDAVPGEENVNSMIQFCEELMSRYNYSKEKIISFMYDYLLNYYRLARSCAPLKDCWSLERFKNHNSFFILMDDWINHPSRRCRSLRHKTDHQMMNLYYINKSYMHLSNNLDPDVNYVKLEESILAIPNYYHHLKMSSLREEVDEDPEDDMDKTNEGAKSVRESESGPSSWINYSW
jgi:hypothetical protein